MEVKSWWDLSAFVKAYRWEKAGPGEVWPVHRELGAVVLSPSRSELWKKQPHAPYLLIYKGMSTGSWKNRIKNKFKKEKKNLWPGGDCHLEAYMPYRCAWFKFQFIPSPAFLKCSSWVVWGADFWLLMALPRMWEIQLDPGSWLPLSPTLAVAGICGVSQREGWRFLSPSFTFQMN